MSRQPATFTSSPLANTAAISSTRHQKRNIVKTSFAHIMDEEIQRLLRFLDSSNNFNPSNNFDPEAPSRLLALPPELRHAI
jgi:hypothetical protein